MKNKKLNKMHDTLQTLYKKRDLISLEQIKKNYPLYALKAQCYIERIWRKTNG